MEFSNSKFIKKFNIYVTYAAILLSFLALPPYLNNNPKDYQNYWKEEAIYQKNRRKFLDAIDEYIKMQEIREKLSYSTKTMISVKCSDED